jgi:rhamnosyltransferase
MNDHVCAVIVTYHPDPDFAEHLLHLRPQVGGLVVVDNRSDDSELLKLRDLAVRCSFTLLENWDNLGIGSALNRGIQWAAAEGRFEYVVLFDQDSEASEGFVSALLTSLQNHPSKNDVALVAPRIYNRNTASFDGPKGVRRGQFLVAQTSGSLMPLSVFESEGCFLDELFIDYVDYEFCLRAVARGWAIHYCDEAELSHAPGNSQRHTLFSVYLGTTGNYSAIRHYYLMRNGTWVLRKYWKRHTLWCAKQALIIFKEITKVLILESDRLAKSRLAIRGLADGLREKFGRLEIPSKEGGPNK